MIAGKIANLDHGTNRHKQPLESSIELSNSAEDKGVSLKDAADALNVSAPSVKRARRVHKHGTEELKDAVVSVEKPKAEERKASKLKQNASNDRGTNFVSREENGRTDDKAAAVTGYSRESDFPLTTGKRGCDDSRP